MMKNALILRAMLSLLMVGILAAGDSQGRNEDKNMIGSVTSLTHPDT